MSALAILKGANALLGVANGNDVSTSIGNLGASPDVDLKNLTSSLGEVFNKIVSGNLSCLGKQAYSKTDFQNQKYHLETLIKNTPKTYSGVEQLLNHFSREIALAISDTSKFRSQCSKNFKMGYHDLLQEALSAYNTSAYTVENKPDHDSFRGVTVNRDYYTLKPNYSPSATFVNNSVSESGVDINDAYHGGWDTPQNGEPNWDISELNGYIAPEREIRELEIVNTGKPVWNVGGSGRTADGVDWNIGAGKREQDNTMKMVMMLGVGLLVYKVLFDKK